MAVIIWSTQSEPERVITAVPGRWGTCLPLFMLSPTSPPEFGYPSNGMAGAGWFTHWLATH